MDQGATAQSGAWLAVRREIAETLDRVDAAALLRFADMFRDERRRWFFSGQGRSGLVAEMAAMRFMHLGRLAHFVGEATAPSIRAGDGLCLVSGSGEPGQRPFRADCEEGGRGGRPAHPCAEEHAHGARGLRPSRACRNNAAVSRQPFRADEPHSPGCDRARIDADRPRSLPHDAEPPHEPSVAR